MAITTIGGAINSTAVLPNLDYKYGPYTSTQEAYDTLGPEGADKLVIGLTVGIIENGEINEYWFKEGTTLADLVLKVSGSEDVDYSQLSNKPSINNVVLNGNKTASDLSLATSEQGSKADSAYQKPNTGIPSTDLSSAVQTSLGKADISVSNTVNDLVNYYLKTETYTQTEVNNLIGAIHQFHFEVYPDLVSVTDPSSNVLYLIGPDTISGSDKYEEYVYSDSQFVKIGDTSIDLSGYVTTGDLEDALKVPIYSSIPSGGMLPNVVYNLGTLSSNTTFTLATPTDNTVLNHYYWTFNIGSTVPTLTWPTGIIWAGDNLSPIIEANKHYEVSVINNIGTYIYSVIS